MGSIRLNGRSYGGSPTVTDANHLTCEDGSGNTITAQSAIQNILGDFATIESSTAASKAYAVGDYLILNGNFYKVTTAISQGDTITVGTNVVRTNVGDEFKSFEFPVRELTKAQYTALPSSQQNDGTIYLITDDDGGWEAENSTYDNTSSGLTATNVQDALDEINSNIDDLGADDIGYDNTTSGLTATNVQDAVDELNSKTVKYGTPLTTAYLACNSGMNQRIQIGASSPDGHYLAYFGQTRIGLYDVTNSTGIGSIPYNPFQVLSATSASTTLSANTCAVVEYNFTVPEGYTIVSVHDDSYYAGVIASPIRIFTRDASTGKQRATFNYLAPAGAGARTYTAKALAVRI